MALWGIHNDRFGAELIERGVVSVGWSRLGDLKQIGDNQARMKEAVADAYPEAKPGAIPVWAGLLRRFAFGLKQGDLVVAPNKSDSTLSFGRISGAYRYEPDGRLHPHELPVTWLKTGVARTLFSQSALYEIGSALTLFQVKKHADEFLRYLDAGSEDDFVAMKSSGPHGLPSVTDDAVSEAPNAETIEQFTRDFIATTLLESLTHEQFEHFTADLLRALGYQARVTQFSGDGGVDVIAHTDPLGLEPPLIKVQCKHTASTQGGPEVQQLIGTLAPNEAGLFVTLGTYTTQALALERGRHNLRLLTGADITDLVLRHYEALPARWRGLIPLRSVPVVDRESQAH